MNFKSLRGWSWVFSLVVILIATWLVRRCGEDHHRSESETTSRAEGPLTVAVLLAPGNFEIDSLGNFGGIQHDLMEKLLPEVQVKWQPFTSQEEALKSLQDHAVDLYASSYPISSVGLPRNTLATKAIYTSGFALVHRRDSVDWLTIFHDGSPEVYIPEGYPSLKQTLEHLKELSFPLMKVIEVPDATPVSLVIDVASGNRDFTVCDRKLATAISQSVENVVFDEDIAMDMFQVWLIDEKDTLLLSRINARIDSLDTVKKSDEVSAK